MKQGEIWYADLSPVKGSEQQGYRPVAIISGNLLNTYLPIVIACPLTTQIKNYKGNLIMDPTKENGLKKKSAVDCFQIRAISHRRFSEQIGRITKYELNSIRKSISLILDIDPEHCE